MLPTALPKAPVPKQQAGGSAGTNGSSSSSSVHGELADGPGALHPPLPLVAEFEQQAGWLVQDTWRDTPFDATTLLENVLDASHVPVRAAAAPCGRSVELIHLAGCSLGSGQHVRLAPSV